MKSGNKIEIGSTSVVGYTARNKKVLLIKDIKKEKTYSINSLLPDTRSEAAIPLLSNKRIYGVLDLHKKEPCSFLDEEIAIINILVDQLSLAIQNSELLSKTQEYLSQNRLLHYVTTAAATSETLQESLNNVVQGLQVAFGDDHIAIMLADNNSRVLNVAAISGYPEEVKKLQVPFGQGVTGWVAKHQQLLNLNDVATDTRYMSVDDNVHAEMAIPIIYRKELLGVLNVESNRITAFSENDEEMLSTLCNNLAAIIANASLFEHIQLQKTRERLLNEATNKIHRSVDMQSIMETTASELCKALDARRIQISIQPNQSGRVIVKHHSKDDASRGVPNENNKKYKSPK